jgi:CII-binding regulator of phage lambda lysogenization HflD
LALFEKIQSLKGLKKAKPTGILTVYLDTDRSKPEQQHGQWKVKLKNGLKKLEEYLDAQNATEEKNRFAALAKKVEREILHLQRNHQKSLLLFASDDLELWEIEILQVEVKNEFHWEEEVVLDQLETINQQLYDPKKPKN